MSRELPTPVFTASLVKIQLPTLIKNELPESEIVEIGMDDILNSSESEEEIIPDVKGIDIVYHPVCDVSIKSEILESKHYESVETQVLVKAENSPFKKTENITQRNKTEDISDENVTKGTSQAVVEVQGSNEYSNVISNVETDAQLGLNSSKDLNDIIGTRSRKAKQLERTNFDNCCKTVETTSWDKDKEKIKVIKAPVIPVEALEYISLAKDKHVCNHCQHACNRLDNLKLHIKRMHREVTTMYQCPYCLYKSKWKRCNLCEMKCKLKYSLTQHMKVHLPHKQMQDRLARGEKRHHCNKCDYKTYTRQHLNTHKLSHLKPEEIQYFYCYHCSYKAKQRGHLKRHIFIHFKNEQVKFDCYICNFITPRRESIIKHIKKHSKVQSKS